jgi:hypothetical protein
MPPLRLVRPSARSCPGEGQGGAFGGPVAGGRGTAAEDRRYHAASVRVLAGEGQLMPKVYRVNLSRPTRSEKQVNREGADVVSKRPQDASNAQAVRV